jgi:hypothetical protein
LNYTALGIVLLLALAILIYGVGLKKVSKKNSHQDRFASMNILLAADTYYPQVSGASYFAQRLATALSSRGHNVAVIAPSHTWRRETYTRQGCHHFNGLASLPALVYKKIPDFFFGRPCLKFVTS